MGPHRHSLQYLVAVGGKSFAMSLLFVDLEPLGTTKLDAPLQIVYGSMLISIKVRNIDTLMYSSK